jgi:hypothetical protein
MRDNREGSMPRRWRLVALACTAVLGTAFAAAPASAHGEATCNDALGSGIVVHGQHIVGDYVTGLGGIFGDGLQWPPAGQVGEAVSANGGAALPGGPGPGFHFTVDGLAPGASFCNEQAHPNGFTTPPAQANGLG